MLTDFQKDVIKGRTDYLLSYIFPDAQDRSAVVEAIANDVINDVEDCADWSRFEGDEYCHGDIDIALARVLKNKIVGE